MDRALSGATTLGQSGPGSNGNEGVLCIPQGPIRLFSVISRTPMGGSYSSAEVQSVYSTVNTQLNVKQFYFR